MTSKDFEETVAHEILESDHLEYAAFVRKTSNSPNDGLVSVHGIGG
jgi:hypothetical protein